MIKINEIIESDKDTIKEKNDKINDVVNYLKSIDVVKKKDKIEEVKKEVPIIKIKEEKKEHKYSEKELKWLEIFNSLGGLNGSN